MGNLWPSEAVSESDQLQQIYTLVRMKYMRSQFRSEIRQPPPSPEVKCDYIENVYIYMLDTKTSRISL